jgi:hypothetical protein
MDAFSSQFLTNGMAGFEPLWQQKCADKAGMDETEEVEFALQHMGPFHY